MWIYSGCGYGFRLKNREGLWVLTSKISMFAMSTEYRNCMQNLCIVVYIFVGYVRYCRLHEMVSFHHVMR